MLHIIWVCAQMCLEFGTQAGVSSKDKTSHILINIIPQIFILPVMLAHGLWMWH